MTTASKFNSELSAIENCRTRSYDRIILVLTSPQKLFGLWENYTFPLSSHNTVSVYLQFKSMFKTLNRVFSLLVYCFLNTINKTVYVLTREHSFLQSF